MKFIAASLLALAIVAGSTPLPIRAQEAPAPAARHLRIVERASALPKAPATGKAPKSAYLMSYFTDEDHSLHFAVSRDGYSFTDVNGGQPVLSGRDIATQKGVRDPYITRGPDGAFYLMMTDLHIFAQREGLRTTQWERPEPQYGWGNNRDMLFLKSYDLLHWTLSRVTISKLFPEYGGASTAWAPELIYDPAARQMMVYFTVRIGRQPDHLVYSYTDRDFTTLTKTPRKLFTYPKPGVSAIDADITRIGNKYHMFYVAHDQPGNLRQAISDKINTGYRFDPKKVDPETVGTEAPTLWKRHGTNTYVLMYDVFGITPNNMGFSETTDFVNFKDIGRFNDPGSPMKALNFKQPKHGAVMAITLDEAKRLEGFFR